jgi:hypothetical protein
MAVCVDHGVRVMRLGGFCNAEGNIEMNAEGAEEILGWNAEEGTKTGWSLVLAGVSSCSWARCVGSRWSGSNLRVIHPALA